MAFILLIHAHMDRKRSLLRLDEILTSLVYIGFCRFNVSLDSYTKTLEIRKRTIGNEHPDYAKSLENVGRTNFELKR